MSQASLRRVFTQDDFDRFAALSGDDNPIHVDPAFSAASKFGRTVAHGVLLITALTGLVEQLRPGATITAQDVRFPAPTFAREEMDFRCWEVGEDLGFAVTRMVDGVTTCDGLFSAPAPKSVGEGDHSPQSEWWRGRADAPAPEARPLPHPVSPGWSPSRIVFATGEEKGRAIDDENLIRVFSAADVDALIQLGGARQPDGSVPIPLIGGLFSYILGTRLPGRGTNYLKQQTRYLAPAPIGEPLTAEVAIVRKRPDKQLIDLSTTCRSAAGSIICEGRALVQAGDVAGAFD